MRLRYALLLFLFALNLPMSAQAVQRAFVSALSGNDANTATGCPATAPCRWFAAALTVVNPNGEIVAMDSGAYGAFTPTTSISIVAAPGVYAGITVFSGNGVTIATAGIDVALRGLSINSMGPSTRGVYMTNGAKLTITDCEFSNFSGVGFAAVYVNTAAAVRVVGSLFRDSYYGVLLSSGATASISESKFFGSGYFGLLVTDAFGGSLITTTAYVDHSVANGNLNAFAAHNVATGNASLLFVADSVITKSTYDAVRAYAPAGVARVAVSNSRIFQNDAGLYASDAGAKLVATGNTVTRNAIGLVQLSSALLESAGDNVVRDNGSNFLGSITTFTKM